MKFYNSILVLVWSATNREIRVQSESDMVFLRIAIEDLTHDRALQILTDMVFAYNERVEWQKTLCNE